MEQDLTETEETTVAIDQAVAGEILSQRDFVSTPFRETAWEVVGERLESLGFYPMEIEILPSDLTRVDPMFADFGGGIGRTESYSHAGQASVVEETGPVIDEAYLEQIRAEAFELGRLQGVEEGRQEATVMAEEHHGIVIQQHSQFQAQIISELQMLAAKTEKNALELALSVARKILVTTADIRPEYILDVIRSALHSTGAGKPLRVRVSPQDYEFLEVIGLPPDLSTEESGVEYVADEAVSAGCIVETDFGEVDLRLDQMWQQVKESLYEVVK